MNLTENEMKILAMLIENEYGEGCGYVFFDEWDMRIYRGVLSSLIQKNIIIEHIGVKTKTESWFEIVSDLNIIKTCLNEAGVKWGW